MNDLELAIRNRIEAEVAKSLSHYSKRVRALQVAVDKLYDDLITLTNDPNAGKPLANGAAKEKKPRAPIKLGPNDRYDVFHVLSAALHPLSIADIRTTLGDRLSGRVIGVALREIVKAGDAIEVKGGKFQAKPVAVASESEDANV